MAYTYVLAGAGLSGSSFARIIAERGHKVLVIEKRNHIAGNLYDEKDSNGILIHKYGPHIFHTNNENVYNFIKRFSKWTPYKLKCAVEMCGKNTPSPFNFTTIDQFYQSEQANSLKSILQTRYPGQKTVTIVELMQCENSLVKEYAQFLFENDYSLYTAKQWGINPSDIDINVLKRVPVRLDYEDAYFSDKYECLPETGYTQFISSMLSHPNIDIQLQTNALDFIQLSENKISFNQVDVETDCKFIYTGPIDQLFSYKFGKLPYRSLYFDFQTHQKNSFQNAPVVAYPQVKDFTRITEYKKLPIQNVRGVTTIAVEYPVQYSESKNNEPYYPIPTDANINNYLQYNTEAAKYSNLVLCGRLAEYKYYNMDQAIEAVLHATM